VMFRGIYRDVIRDQLESRPDGRSKWRKMTCFLSAVKRFQDWTCDVIYLNSGVTKIIPR
jgi:hypothetical protein